MATPSLPEMEWIPGEKSAWQMTDSADQIRDETLRAGLGKKLNATITAAAVSGNYLYAGSADGQIWTSADSGLSWSPPSDRGKSPVESIVVSPKDGRIALAALGNRIPNDRNQRPEHVLKTMNGGIFWDDVTANLPNSGAHGIAADFTSGAVYVATDNGVFMTAADLTTAGPATPWTALGGSLPTAAALDVRLDAGANQLFVAIAGSGRLLHPRSASDARYPRGQRGRLERPRGGPGRSAERDRLAGAVGSGRRSRHARSRCLRNRLPNPGAF